MKMGTATIGMLLTFIFGVFIGNYMAKGKHDEAGASASVASIEDQERALGPGDPKAARTRVLIAPNDQVKGPESAKVTIIEFSDFQCPFCSRVLPTIKQIEDTYGDDVRLVFKHTPLPFHKDAPLASTAALAAGEQGKFWEYHDKLFANQKALDRSALESYANELQLDMTKFKAALDSDKFKDQIERDKAYAAKVGARGTPTFFVNGMLVRGAQPFPNFKSVIDSELAHAKSIAQAQGVSGNALYAALMKDARVGMAPTPGPTAMPGVPDPSKTYKVPVGNSPVHGDPGAALTIIEFSDFQCPFCSRVLPTLESLKEKYGKDVRIVFKNQPLPMHPMAPLAAEAGLAANAQGKFWAMHDKMFGNQQALDRASLEKYAQEIGLNVI